MLLAFVGWILIGLVVGFIASKLVNLRGDDPLVGIACALVGALVGGLLFSILSGRGIVAWDPWSMLTSVGGAAVGAALYHAIRSRSIPRDHKSVRRSN